MKYIAKEQIKKLFTNPQETKSYGLFFSGYEDDGEFKVWYINGQLAIQSFFKNGKRDGEYKKWDMDGELKRHILYKNDRAIRYFIK